MIAARKKKAMNTEKATEEQRPQENRFWSEDDGEKNIQGRG